MKNRIHWALLALSSAAAWALAGCAAHSSGPGATARGFQPGGGAGAR